jgi:hypothetical protein
MKYIVTIDIPVMMRFEAPDEDTAGDLADTKFAQIYEVLESVVTNENTWFGDRYDNTEVEPDR